MSRHSADVKEFKRKVQQNRTPKTKRTFHKNHKWRNPKKDPLTEHYMVIINIPEAMAEFYKGKSSPEPRYARMHTFVRAFTKKGSEVPKGTLNLFPKSTVSDIRCTGDETCLVCKRIQEMRDELGIEGYGSKATIPDELDKNQQKIARSLIQATDSYGKGKKRVIFAGINFVRDESNGNQWKLNFERYSISEKYWNDDFMTVLADTREEDEEEWKYEEHPEDEFTLDGVTKKLKDFTKEEQQLIFLQETDQKYPIVWDMETAHMLKYVEDGDFGDSKSVMTVRKAYPYFPPQYIDELKGEEKKRFKKLSKKSEELYNWIIENIEELPNIEEYCPAEMDEEKQAELLGVKFETKRTMENVSVKEEESETEEIEDDFFGEDDTTEVESTDGDDFFDGDDDGFKSDNDFDLEEPI